MISAKPNGTTLADALRLLRVAKQYTISIGGLPNFYCVQSHGRLGPLGFHVIGVPKLVRELLFEGSGLCDFDLVSCFPSIFASLGRAYGFPTEMVERYISDKQRYHEYWTFTTKTFSADVFKPLVASFFTGGKLSPSPKTAGARALGHDAMELLRTNEAACRLYDEIRSGMKRIIQESTKERDGRDMVFLNAVGARLQVSRERSDFGKICAHLLTGYEQFAIRTVSRHVEGLRGIIYDGFVALPQRTCGLEAHIQAASVKVLGLKLDLRLKQQDLSEPVPDVEPDGYGW